MRSTSRIPTWLAAALVAVTLAACGSATPSSHKASAKTPAGSSPTTTVPATATTPTTAPGATTPTTAPGATTPTTAPKPFFTQTETGTKDTRTFTARESWRLTWSYTCAALGHKGSFTLVLRPAHGSTTKVTSQEGLGGGGNHVYKAGRYSLSVTTPCQWTVQGAAA